MTDLLLFSTMAVLFILPILMIIVPLLSRHSRQSSIILDIFLILIPLNLIALLVFRIYPRTILLNDLLSFSFSQNGLLIGLLTYLLCGIVYLTTGQSYCKEISRKEAICGILSLWAANFAFFAGNFLLRYIFLELLALGIVLLVLFGNKLWEGFRLARSMFLFLKIGDLGMLIGVLILQTQTGLLEIQSALDSSINLSLSVLTWVQAGFLLAALVKMGVWPFDTWLALGRVSAKRSLTWFSTLLIPAMGLYLLYRIAPTFAVSSLNSNIVFYGTFTLIAFAFAQSAFKPDKRSAPILGTLLGALVLMFASFGSGRVVFWCLIINLITRTGLELLARVKSQTKVSYSLFSLVSGILLISNLWMARDLASLPQLILCVVTILLIIICINLKKFHPVPENFHWRFKEYHKISEFILNIEHKCFQAGVEKFYMIVIRIVQSIYFACEVRFMEILLAWGTKIMQSIYFACEIRFMEILLALGTKIIHFSFRTLEDRGFIQGERKVIGRLIKGSQGMSRLEDRSFHQNLLWIPIMLLMIILFLTFLPNFVLENK
ncbi:MAG: hypothetical protein MUO40_00140 [Anaerolineaceae bacterium]|nr:hypothetical protein [Anaerolineaceae bacterium]